MTSKSQASPSSNIQEAFFPVQMRSSFVDTSNNGDGSSTKRVDKFRAIIDVERDNVFAVVTAKYKLVTNQQAYEMSKNVMHRVFKVIKLEDLKCLYVHMPSTRSFCHIDLIHRGMNFTLPTRSDDGWTAFLRITNSYNRTKKLSFELGFCRWICDNKMIFGSKSVTFSDAHTKEGGLRMEKFIDNLGEIGRIEASFIAQMDSLRSIPIQQDALLPLACRVFGFDDPPNKIVSAKDKKKRRLVEMRDAIRLAGDRYYRELDATGYAAMNVLTDYATRPGPERELDVHELQRKSGDWIDEFTRIVRNPGFNLGEYLAPYQATASAIAEL